MNILVSLQMWIVVIQATYKMAAVSFRAPNTTRWSPMCATLGISWKELSQGHARLADSGLLVSHLVPVSKQ